MVVFGMDPQAFVVLIVAAIGLVPVALYYGKVSQLFVLPYGFLLFAAFATNFENLFLPDLLNFSEHLLGNMGAGIAFAVAAYMYRQRSIETDDDTQTGAEV